MCKKTVDFADTSRPAPAGPKQPDFELISFNKCACPFHGQGVYFGQTKLDFPGLLLAWLDNLETALAIGNTARGKQKAIDCPFGSLSLIFTLFEVLEQFLHRLIDGGFDTSRNHLKHHRLQLGFGFRLGFLFLRLASGAVNSHFFTSTFAVKLMPNSSGFYALRSWTSRRIFFRIANKISVGV